MIIRNLSIIIIITTVLAGYGWSYEAERSSHTFESGSARLEAVLVTPTGGRNLKGAVVFIGGSGSSKIGDYTPGFLEELVESIFLPRDIAVFYYNKRGIGKSTGNWKWGSIERRAEDTLAAVSYLSKLPGIDPQQIGLFGHSQGGWVVQEAGGRDSGLAFVISLAGPVVTVREQDRKREEINFECEGMENDELERRLVRLDRKHALKIRVGRWFPFFELRLMSNILPYNPAEALKAVTSPTLLAFAEMDSMVPPEQNRNRFDEIFPDGSPSEITWHVADSTDHMFRITDTICFDYSASLENPYSQDFRRYLGSWVDEIVIR